MHGAGCCFWQGDGKYCGWRCELDAFLTAGIYGADSGGQGRRGGKSKAGVDTVNKSNVYVDGHMHTLACQWLIITPWLCVFGSESLSSHSVSTAVSLSAAHVLLGVFQKTKSRSKQRQRANDSLRTVWLLSERLSEKKKCFRVNPVSSWTVRTEWQADGAKKCEQCQWAQRELWAIQRTEAVKIKGLSLIHSVIRHNALFCSVFTRVIKVFFSVKLIGVAFDTDCIWKTNTSCTCK